MNHARTENAGLWMAGVLFGLMALAQLARLVIRPEVVVAGHHVPLWPSGLALAILAGMSIWMVGLARGSNAHPMV